MRTMVEPSAMASVKSSLMPIDRHSMDTLSYFFALMSTKRLRISAKYLQLSPSCSLTGGMAISPLRWQWGYSAIFAAVCIGTTEALFALVCIFINGKVIDMVMLGLSRNKACFVMSDKWAEISHQVLNDMDRGATQLSARGAYSGKERPVLLCVLPPQDVARFKEIVRKEDDRAFMFITEAHEALGEGFDKLAEKD